MTTTQPTEETTMRVPSSPDAPTPTDRTPEPVRVVYLPEVITDRAAIRDSDEPDEPRVNGDLLRVMCEYAEPATGATVAALDLDAIEADARTADRPSWFTEEDIHDALGSRVAGYIAGMDPATTLALVAYARRKSTLAADNHQRAENTEHLLRLRSDALARVTREAEALRAQVAAVEAMHVPLGEGDDRWCEHDGFEWPCHTRAALATTGEGK